MNDKAKHIDVTEEQKQRIEQLRITFSDVYGLLELWCKPNRETSLAITKLEEAQFWAIKGISRE